MEVSVRTIGVWGLAAVLVGCAGAKRVTPQEISAAERPLDAPFQQKRSIVADNLLLELSANFYDAVALPALQAELHELQREKTDEHDEYRWINKSGGVEVPLRFALGATEYAILEKATLRVMHRGPMTLRSVASGHVIVIVDAAADMSQLQEFRIEDGLVRTK